MRQSPFDKLEAKGSGWHRECQGHTHLGRNPSIETVDGDSRFLPVWAQEKLREALSGEELSDLEKADDHLWVWVLFSSDSRGDCGIGGGVFVPFPWHVFGAAHVMGPHPFSMHGTACITFTSSEVEKTLDGARLVSPADGMYVWHWPLLTDANSVHRCPRLRRWCLGWWKLMDLGVSQVCLLLSLNCGYLSERHFKCIVFHFPIRFSLICVPSHMAIRWVGTKLPKQLVICLCLSTHSKRRERISFLVSIAKLWQCSREGSKQNENGRACYCSFQKEHQGQEMQGETWQPATKPKSQHCVSGRVTILLWRTWLIFFPHGF